VIKGEASLLLYYMEKNLMDTSILAGYVGLPSFIVKLHMRPFFFKMLGNKTLEKYAYAFRMPLNEMIDPKKISPSEKTGVTL
jgi:hypothetical protein